MSDKLTKHEKRLISSIAKSDKDRLVLVSHPKNPFTLANTEKFGVGHSEKIRQEALTKAFDNLTSSHAKWTIYMFMREEGGRQRTRMKHVVRKDKTFGQCFDELASIANAMQIEHQIESVSETAWVLYPEHYERLDKNEDAFSQICRHHGWEI